MNSVAGSVFRERIINGKIQMDGEHRDFFVRIRPKYFRILYSSKMPCPLQHFCTLTVDKCIA
jgi:hypothetical protein